MAPTPAPTAKRLLRLYVLHAADPGAEVTGLAQVADPDAAASPLHVAPAAAGWKVAA